MPRFDGTGPAGQGPMTGGGFGQCTDSNARPLRGRGRRKCTRHRYFANTASAINTESSISVSAASETEATKTRAEYQNLSEQIDTLAAAVDKLAAVHEETPAKSN